MDPSKMTLEEIQAYESNRPPQSAQNAPVAPVSSSITPATSAANPSTWGPEQIQAYEMQRQQMQQRQQPTSQSQWSSEQLNASAPTRDPRMVPFTPESLEFAGKAAGAWNAAVENIPAKVNYNIDSTINSLAKALGVVSPQEYGKKQKLFDAQLEQSLGKGGTSSMMGGYEQDIAAHPNFARGVQDIGALGAEIVGAGGAANLAGKGIAKVAPGLVNALQGSAVGRVASGVASDIGQGALVSALEAKDNKGEAALIGGGLSAMIGAPLRTAGEIISGITKGGKSTEEVAKTFNKAKEVERSTIGEGTLSLDQKLNNPYLRSLKERARNAPIYGMEGPHIKQQLNLSNYIDDSIPRLKTVGDTPLEKTAGDVMASFDGTRETLKTLKDTYYQTAINKLKSANQGGIEATGAQSAAQTLLSQVDNLDDLGANKSLIKEQIEKVLELTKGPQDVEKIYERAIKIGKWNDTLMKNLNPITKDSSDMLGALRGSLMDDLGAAAFRSGLDKEWSKASSYYRDVYKPFDSIPVRGTDSLSRASSLAKYLKDTNAKGMKPESIMKELGPQVQDELKRHVLTDIINRSSVTDKISGNLKPQQFMANYAKEVKRHGMIFTPKDAKLAESMVKLNNVIGTVSDTPPNVGSFNSLLSIWPRFFLNSDLGQEVLLKTANLPVNSPGVRSFINAVNGMLKTAGKAAVVGTSVGVASQLGPSTPPAPTGTPPQSQQQQIER